MLRFLSIAVFAFLPLLAQADPAWLELDSITTTGSPAGVWRIAGGKMFSIEPRAGEFGVYDLILLHGNDLSVPSGTVFGSLRAGADSHTFNAKILALTNGPVEFRLARPRNFMLIFDSTFSTFEFRCYQRGIIINLVRILPYLFRAGMESRYELPSGVIGASRCNGQQLEYPITL